MLLKLELAWKPSTTMALAAQVLYITSFDQQYCSFDCPLCLGSYKMTVTWKCLSSIFMKFLLGRIRNGYSYLVSPFLLEYGEEPASVFSEMLLWKPQLWMVV